MSKTVNGSLLTQQARLPITESSGVTDWGQEGEPPLLGS